MGRLSRRPAGKGLAPGRAMSCKSLHTINFFVFGPFFDKFARYHFVKRPRNCGLFPLGPEKVLTWNARWDNERRVTYATSNR